MALRSPAFFLTAFAVLALLAAPPATAATADPASTAADTAACTPTVLVTVCVYSLDCIVVLVLGQPFAVIGCA